MTIVKINAGGTKFSTNKSILLPSEYFRSIFERWNNSDEIFIDMEPKIFSNVLNLLRNPNHEISYIDQNNTLNALVYLQIPFNENNILTFDNIYSLKDLIIYVKLYLNLLINKNYKIIIFSLILIILLSSYITITNLNISNQNNEILDKLDFLLKESQHLISVNKQMHKISNETIINSSEVIIQYLKMSKENLNNIRNNNNNELYSTSLLIICILYSFVIIIITLCFKK
jgi:hypothetical protein